jgi:protein-tyrosine phosphatase
MKILMVCLGNICRSPLAEGILKKKIKDNNLNASVASTGFVSYHLGNPADRRAISVAARFGVDLSKHKASVFSRKNFDLFDHIYVMDQANLNDVLMLARNKTDQNKVDFIMNELYPGENRIVPDPYYGGAEDFVSVYKMLDAACDAIIEKIKKEK